MGDYRIIDLMNNKLTIYFLDIKLTIGFYLEPLCIFWKNSANWRQYNGICQTNIDLCVFAVITFPVFLVLSSCIVDILLFIASAARRQENIIDLLLQRFQGDLH